ncbi:cyclase family protein [bacterium]|nr:cyclase family protein [bacterium]
MHKLVDLSHSLEAGMITYKGIPAPKIHDFMKREESRNNYAPGVEFHIGIIEMAANTGTYLDTPFHRYVDGTDLSQLSLSRIADLEGVKIDTDRSRRIDVNILKNLDLKQKAVLFHTGWDKHWRTEQYFEGHPFLTRKAVEYLVDSEAGLVGIDSFNIDDTADLTRPAHSLLLKAGIPIVEHLCNLQSLPRTGFRFFAVPPMVKDFGSFPVRAFAIV